MSTNTFKFISANSLLYVNTVNIFFTQQNMTATTKLGFSCLPSSLQTNSKLTWTVLFPEEKNVSQVGNRGETSCQHLLHFFKMFLDLDLDEEIKFTHIYKILNPPARQNESQSHEV